MSALPSSPAATPTPDAPWVVCLCAEWCGTCRDYRPLIAQVARAHPALNFAWVDIEDHAEIADDFDVETFPTVLVVSGAGVHFLGPLLPHAQTLDRLLGALPAAAPASADIQALIDAVRAEPARFALAGG